MITVKINCVRSHRRAGFNFIQGKAQTITLEGEDFETVLETLRRDPELHVQIVDDAEEGDDGVEPSETNGKSTTKKATPKRSTSKKPAAKKTVTKTAPPKTDAKTEGDGKDGDETEDGDKTGADADGNNDANDGASTDDGAKTE